MRRLSSPLEEKLFQEIAGAYTDRWRVGLCMVTHGGSVLRDHGACEGCAAASVQSCDEARAFAVSEGLRWGEPSVTPCPCGRLLWAVPLMVNAQVIGGLVANADEAQVLGGGEGPRLDIARVCGDLRRLAEERNLTNAAALGANRRSYHDEQQRAHAIHAFKSGVHYSIRELYMREEPALLAAIRSGDRRAAREILNRLLMTVHYHARDRIDLVRSILLELVVTMSRTAVEAGGQPEQFLGMNYRSMVEVAEITSHEALAAWLREMLEGIMDAIERAWRQDPGFLIFEALDFMRRHCCEDISRDDVAAAVHLSPSHFSALMARESGASFTEHLNRMRTDRAAEMLARTDKPVAAVALECGFRDQSYFTKVFKRYRSTTPWRYRREASGSGGRNAP